MDYDRGPWHYGRVYLPGEGVTEEDRLFDVEDEPVGIQLTDYAFQKRHKPPLKGNSVLARRTPDMYELLVDYLRPKGENEHWELSAWEHRARALVDAIGVEVDGPEEPWEP